MSHPWEHRKRITTKADIQRQNAHPMGHRLHGFGHVCMHCLTPPEEWDHFRCSRSIRATLAIKRIVHGG